MRSRSRSRSYMRSYIRVCVRIDDTHLHTMKILNPEEQILVSKFNLSFLCFLLRIYTRICTYNCI